MTARNTLLYASSLALALCLVGCGTNHDGVQAPSPNQNDTPKPSALAGSKTDDRLFSDIVLSPNSVSSAVDDASEDSSGNTPSSRPSTSCQWTDEATARSLAFAYRNDAQGNLLMPEAVGGGVGVFDFDLDGRADFAFSQGGSLAQRVPGVTLSIALFRQADSSTFSDVSIPAGLFDGGYGQGIALGDFNADGFEDIYLTCVGQNRLLANNGDGTFTEITRHAIPEPESSWSTSAAWFDLTGDGLLDLYVCNYVEYDIEHPKTCRDSAGEKRICSPSEFSAVDDFCYVNQGDGTFKDEARARGLFGKDGKGLGVAIADFNNDSHPDIYVANDTTANFYFRGSGAGTFTEEGMVRGCATNFEGLFQASMGLAVSDFDRNGFQDIYATHYFDESNTLYRNLGDVGFQDATARFGLHVPTLKFLGFGCVVTDFDRDGTDEIFIANGHVDNHPNNTRLAMTPQFFGFDGSRFVDMSTSAGPYFSSPRVGRGVAMCDLDQDQAIDLAVVHQDSPVSLLKNKSTLGHGLSVRLVGTRSPRFGEGTQVRVHASENLTLLKEVVGGAAYLSTHEKVLSFGLGQHHAPVRLEVRWPSGLQQTIEDVPVDQELTLTEPS